jgi:hypothetical protein
MPSDFAISRFLYLPAQLVAPATKSIRRQGFIPAALCFRIRAPKSSGAALGPFSLNVGGNKSGRAMHFEENIDKDRASRYQIIKAETQQYRLSTGLAKNPLS